MFNPNRLIIARKRRGFSKKNLANLSGFSDRILLAYEKGDAVPTEDTLNTLAKCLSFSPIFFSGQDLPEIAPNGASFRALSTLPAYKRDAALSAGWTSKLINNWFERFFDLPKTQLPDLGGYEPEAAAQALRAEWQLGNSPVKNIIHLLESKGVRIYSLPQADREVDAFCFWDKKIPFILMNTTKSAERSRFDISHELGHLVLHRHGKPQGRLAEQEADKFASAFLMPAESVYAKCSHIFLNISQVIKAKENWKVSAAALNHRLHSLKITSEWTYRMFCIDLAQKGFNKKEPNPIEREYPQIFKKIFASLNKIKKYNIANDLGLSHEDLRSLTFDQYIGLIKTDNPVNSNNTQRTKLQLLSTK